MSRLSRLNPHFKPAFDGFKIAKELLLKLSQSLEISEAYIFGSCAEGKNTENSDLDLLVIIPNESEVKEYYRIVNTPFFSPVAVDWIFVTKEEFLKNREVGGISRVAFITGKRVWSNGSAE